MKMFEVAKPITSVSEHVLGVVESIEQVQALLVKDLKDCSADEVRYVIRKVNDEDYMQ